MRVFGTCRSPKTTVGRTAVRKNQGTAQLHDGFGVRLNSSCATLVCSVRFWFALCSPQRRSSKVRGTAQCGGGQVGEEGLLLTLPRQILTVFHFGIEWPLSQGLQSWSNQQP